MKKLLFALLFVPLLADAGVVQSCPAAVQLQLAPTGCRGGSAVAQVEPVDGATYAWTVQGATLVGGAGTERIVVALGSGNTVKVSVLVNSPACGALSATAVMALQDPFTVKSFDVAGGTHAGQTRTLTWSYQNGEPVLQTLTGSDFAQPVILPGNARSYSYTPSLYGNKSVALDASMVPLPARMHAAGGRGGAPSSSCNTVHAEAKFHVDCNTPDATISAPRATGVGLPFTASVKLPAGTSASWTIDNGAPATASGASVSITPTGGAPVGVHVTVTADTCAASSDAQVSVDATLGCAVVPQATMAITSSDCDKAVIAVRLAGTPPFSGTWSDGEPFLASGFSAERTVTAAGDYSIKNFRDAFCPGQATALKVALKPTATLSTSGGTCVIGGDSTAVITFTGTPPFLGEWSDSVAFNTTATRLERKITQPIDLTLKWFQDSKCDGIVSGRAAFGTPGTASVRLVSPANGCLVYGNDPSLAAQVAVDLIGTPPFTVTWADGTVQNVAASPALRYFAPPRGNHYALTVARARDALCDLTLVNPTVTLAVTAAPQISLNGLLWTCPGQDTNAKLLNIVAVPGQTITWRMDHGTIKGGQGTPDVTFAAEGNATVATLFADLGDPNSCTATASLPVPFPPPPGPMRLTANPSTIALGQSTTITLTQGETNYAYVNQVSPSFQFLFQCSYKPSCTYVFTPASRGTYDIQAYVTNYCSFPYLNTIISVNVQ